MCSCNSITLVDQEAQSIEEPSLEISDAVNQCNTTTDGVVEDSNSESKTVTPDVLFTENGLDRYLVKLHTNLDSRFPIPNTLSTEIRRWQMAGVSKTNILPMKRWTLSVNPFTKRRIPESERPAEDTLSISPLNGRKLQRTAKNWPNPMTSKDQATLVQDFCAYFYERYCTTLGDLQSSDLCTNPSKQDSPAVETSMRGDPHDRTQSKATEPRHALCPYFFTSSLADAMKMAERPAGRPWPVILLYLHHHESTHTLAFVTNVLCSLREDYKSQVPGVSGVQTGETSELSRDTPTISNTEEEKGLGQRMLPARQDGSTASDLQVPPPKFSKKTRHLSVILAKSNSQQTSIWQSGGGGRCRKSTSRTVSAATPRSATLERDNLNSRPPELSKNSTRHRKCCGMARSVMPPKQTNINSGCESRQDDLNLLVPSQKHTVDSDKPESVGAIPKLTVVPGDGGECEELNHTVNTVDKSEDKRAYETSYKTTSFRGLLLERGAGLIPWDCTERRARSYLAAAFPGTRLVQWLAEWRTPEFYPILVAVGRTAERDVVCSYLAGPTATATSALQWLSDVTTAHFNNYRQPIIPTCPERSEKIVPSPTVSNSSPAERPQVQTKTPGPVQQLSLTTLNTCAQPTTILRANNPGASGVGEPTEHIFISMLNMRSNQRQMLSPRTADDIAYRLTKTPQIQDGPLSTLFELPVKNSSEKLREHLRRVESSFKAAASTLAKSETAEFLASIGFNASKNLGSKSFGPSKSGSSQMMVDTVCKTSSMEVVQSSAQSSTPGEIAPGQLIRKMAVIPSDLDHSTSEISAHPKRSSLNASYTSDKQRDSCAKHPESKHKRIEQISFCCRRESTDRPTTGSPNALTPPKIVHKWWSVLSTRSTFQDLRNGTEFYTEFSERFTKEFPATPVFLIGRLQTAVLKSMDVINHKQIAPILIYLHDDQAPGVDHFVANIMCSRRFTSNLFDHGLHIWPLNVSAVSRKPVRLNRFLSFRSLERVDSSQHTLRRADSTTQCLTEMASLAGSAQTLGRAIASFGWNQLRSVAESNKLRLWCRRETSTDHSASDDMSPGSVASQDLPLEAPHNTLNHISANVGSLAAQQLLDYFQGHPAQESIRSILSIPILPALINLQYHNHTFSVTHVLIPSSTTKDSISWLNSVIKLYSNSRTC